MTPKNKIDYSISHLHISKVEHEKTSLLEKLAILTFIISLPVIYFCNQHAKKPAKDANHVLTIPMYSNSLELDNLGVQKKLYVRNDCISEHPKNLKGFFDNVYKSTPAADYRKLGLYKK